VLHSSFLDLIPHPTHLSVRLFVRYGTTTFSLPPYKVLHTDLIGADADKLKAAVTSPDKPMVVVVAHEGLSPSVAKQLLMDAGLWYL
jgi:hypothetical protein